MTKVFFERLIMGRGFRVHVDVKLTKEPTSVYMNARFYGHSLNDTGLKLYEKIKEIHGIDREIMISTYSFETGIALATDARPPLEAVLKAIMEVVDEPLDLTYQVPGNRVTKVLSAPEPIRDMIENLSGFKKSASY